MKELQDQFPVILTSQLFPHGLHLLRACPVAKTAALLFDQIRLHKYYFWPMYFKKLVCFKIEVPQYLNGITFTLFRYSRNKGFLIDLERVYLSQITLMVSISTEFRRNCEFATHIISLKYCPILYFSSFCYQTSPKSPG